MTEYKYLDPGFLRVMDEIGQYGDQKYGEQSFYRMAARGDRSRPTPRHSTEEIIKHGSEHGHAYLRGELHDAFGTKRHQLAAAAFNAMMEFVFADLKNES